MAATRSTIVAIAHPIRERVRLRFESRAWNMTHELKYTAAIAEFAFRQID